MELLIALGILVFSVSAAIMVVFGAQTIAVDSEIQGNGLLVAREELERARAKVAGDFFSIGPATSTRTVVATKYDQELSVVDISPCAKQVTSTVRWNQDQRSLRFDIGSVFADIPGAVAVGGDCAISSPESNWDNPQTFASDNFNPGKPRAVDVLRKIVYMGGDKTPFLFIADARNATLGQSSGLFVTFANGYAATSTINDLDVAAWQDPVSGETKYYVYAAMDSATDQLNVVDVTDIENPTLVAARTLSSCVTGSYPEGWRIAYYRDRVYLTTRETAGPEFHVFDVADPTNPVELGSGGCVGTNLGTTVNGMVVRDQVVSGATARFAYLAVASDTTELRVLDVTDPITIVGSGIATANKNLPGNQDGQSVYAVGNKLYFGRQSAPSGPDLYVYDIADPFAGLPQLGAQDIGTGITSMVVANRFAFFGTPKTNQEFQVWNITDHAAITNIAKWNFPNIVENGLDYEPDFVYASSQGNDALRIVYSP